MSVCLFLVCTSHLKVGLMVADDDDMRKVDKYIIQRSHNLCSQRDAKKSAVTFLLIDT